MNSVSIPTMEPDRQYYFMNQCKTLVLEKKAALNRPLTYNIQTFGCQMNSHDSEKLKGIMDEIGYEEVDDEAADFVIFNTCTIRENANQKLYGHLGHVKTLKNKNKDMIVCLCGCMMQEPHVIETLKQKYKFVNIIFGTHNIYKLAELIYSYLETGKQTIEVLDETKQTVEQLPRKRKYTFKSGVNIMYGCNNFCTYCIVPYVRGREQSRKKEEILAEVEALAKQGISEVMLLGQNVNSYGNIYEYKDGKIVEVDEKDRVTFPQLLTEVCKIDGIERVRFMTSHPKDLSDELIERTVKTKIQRRQLPTAANVIERQRDQIISKMQTVLELNAYHDYMPIAESLLDDYSAEEVAAAALKLMQEGIKALEAPQEDILSKDLRNTGGRPGMVRLFINIGRSQKIMVKDIVSTIAIEADIPARDIGLINIYDKFTFVEVPEDVAEKVIGAMNKNFIKGYKVNIEPAKARR